MPGFNDPPPTARPRQRPVLSTKAAEALLQLAPSLTGVMYEGQNILVQIEAQARQQAIAEITVEIANQWISSANDLLDKVDHG